MPCLHMDRAMGLAGDQTQETPLPPLMFRIIRYSRAEIGTLFYFFEKPTKKIAFSLDIFVFRAILVHVNPVPEATPVLFSELNHNPFDRLKQKQPARSPIK